MSGFNIGRSPERDFHEDFDKPNGCYSHICCKCKEDFTGFKCRIFCKLCDLPGEGRQTRQKVPEGVDTVRNSVTGELHIKVDGKWIKGNYPVESIYDIANMINDARNIAYQDRANLSNNDLDTIFDTLTSAIQLLTVTPEAYTPSN